MHISENSFLPTYTRFIYQRLTILTSTKNIKKKYKDEEYNEEYYEEY